MPSSRTGARLLVDQLLVHGVEHVFCVPGESYLPVLDALLDAAERIRLVVNRHESGSTFMADAAAKLTGRPGIAFVTRGPGATNASIGVHTAFQDSTPLVLFIGQVGNDFVEREAFQEIDYRRMFGPMTKWVAQIDRAARIPEYVARAFSVATSGRPGPVVLALPEDVLDETTDVDDALPFATHRASPSSDELARLAAMLDGSRAPLMMLGGSGWDHDACAAIRSFAERFALPVACVFRRQDLFDNRHPQYVGDVGIAINPKLAARVKEADVLLVVGARLGEMTTSGYALVDVPVPKQRIIHVHADANELGRVVQPALGIVASPAAFARSTATLAPSRAIDRAAFIAVARTDYERWQDEPAVLATLPDAVNPWRVLRTLESALPDDFILCNGAGNFATWGHRFHRYAGLRTQLAPTSGAMGYGVPAGIAAKLCAPDRTVVVFAGDGDFTMTGQELATAARERAGVIVVVFDNAMYGTIRMHQERTFPGRVSGTSLSDVDFVALARGYGAWGARVEATDAFAATLDDALAHVHATDLPAVIELRMDPRLLSPSLVVDAPSAAVRTG